jgi:hypothetical protein
MNNVVDLELNEQILIQEVLKQHFSKNKLTDYFI